MENFFLVFACMTLGFLFRKFPRFPVSTGKSLNSFVICVSLPAVVLINIPKLIKNSNLSFDLLIPITMPYIVFITSAFFFANLGKKLNWNKKTIGAIILTAGLGNTSFVGFPLLEALIGIHAIQVAILIDQLGSFMTVSFLGIFVASLYSHSHSQTANEKINFKKIFLNMLKFPPFPTLVFISLYTFLGFELPTLVYNVVYKISLTLVPLALFAVGFQLNIKKDILALKWKQVVWGLGYKILIIPLVLTFFYIVALDKKSEMVHITILESAMAPMITAAAIAGEFELDSELANLMVGIGVPLSLITVPVWYYFLI